MNRTAIETLVPRGVYWARYLKSGRPIAYAVDSNGDVVRRYVVMYDSRCDAAVEALWNYLDVVDPVRKRPHIQLVNRATIAELPRAERRKAIVFDPYDQGPLQFARRVE